MPDAIDAEKGRGAKAEPAEPGVPMSDEQYAEWRLEQATGGIRLRDWTSTDQPVFAAEPIEMPIEEETDDRAAA